MAKFNIETVRHSAAHLMAQAIARTFPNEKIQFGIGPTIDNGFYYDLDMEHRLVAEDLSKIEANMKVVIAEDLKINKSVLSKAEALKLFGDLGQDLKIDLILNLPENEEISCYDQGEFTDLCRGPHVETTKQIPQFFKLLSIAGAYWKGDSNNKMLQRVYAVCFFDKKQLKAHLNFLEEAKKRDHRQLGKELELFHFDPVAPGSPFFMPKGAFIYNQLIEYMRKIYTKFDYKEVITPQILNSSLWKTSGHYDHYKENMYFSNIDETEYAIKPMNCPCHMLMFKHYKYSYRDLPLRYADFGRIHRYEKAGALAGITRVRTFCQDDAHIFIALAGVQEEIKLLMKMFSICYQQFGFDKIKINLSTRPAKKSGDDKTWDIAENALKDALEQDNYEYTVKAGDGAFYGPKIDVEISDAIGRYHQLGTIQLDFQLPERFDLNFTNATGEAERPVVIHRALLGSLERFFGVYIEHCAGAFPFWIAPEQAVIVPINNDSHLSFAQDLALRLKEQNYRVRIDDRNESMGYKTRQIQKSKIPYMLVIGDREIAEASVSMRKYGEKKTQTININDLIVLFKQKQTEGSPSTI